MMQERRCLEPYPFFCVEFHLSIRDRKSGWTNCKRNDISEYDDISTIDQYQEALRAGLSEEEALKCCYENSRDNARTPMQWSDGKMADLPMELHGLP